MNTNSRNVTYSTVGDYQLPNLILNQPRKPLGKYGRLRRTYLKEQRPVLYHTMLLNGSLYPHLMEVEQTAESRMQQTMAQLLKQNPAPDLSLIHISYSSRILGNRSTRKMGCPLLVKSMSCKLTDLNMKLT